VFRCEKFLQRPASTEPTTTWKFFRIHTVGIQVPKRYVTDRRCLIPLKHGVDRFSQLSAAGLVDTARVYPKVVKAILVPTELDLLIPYFVLTRVVDDVLKRDLLVIRSPRVR
jgi:hypothetical protein